MDVKGQHIGPVLFRDLEAVQNGGKDVAQHAVVDFVQPQRIGAFQRRAEQPLVPCDVFQVRCQIGRRYQVQFLQRALPDAGDKIMGIQVHICQKLVVEVLHTLAQQIPYGFVMQIKGGTVHPGGFADFLHRNILDVFLFQQAQKSHVHPGGGMKVFAFGFVHRGCLLFPAAGGAPGVVMPR